MVSAICPNCHIILVEANSPTTANLGTGVNAAVSLGAKFVSNSYGGSESSVDTTYDTEYYNHPGVAVTASAGDDGYGVDYPAASPVRHLGRRHLADHRVQLPRLDRDACGSSRRRGHRLGLLRVRAPSRPGRPTPAAPSGPTTTSPPIADPNTGVAVYDSYSEGGWLEVGGTSASSPIIASVFALAGTPAAGTYPASYIYAHTSNLFDVTSGCGRQLQPGLPVHRRGRLRRPDRLGHAGRHGGVHQRQLDRQHGHGDQPRQPDRHRGHRGQPADPGHRLGVRADPHLQRQRPAGAACRSTPRSGLISGTPTTAGSSTVTVTAKDTTGASGSATFTWTISSSGGGCAAEQLFGNPGFETGSISPWTSTAGVLANTSDGVPAHSGSWLAWLDGYGGAHTDTLAQSVTIPSTCKNATLSFWLDISTNDPASAGAADTFTVQVLNSSGTVLATLATLSNLNSTGGYTQYSYNVGAYIGQTITIKYTGKETLRNHNTSFFNDDNALNVS